MKPVGDDLLKGSFSGRLSLRVQFSRKIVLDLKQNAAFCLSVLGFLFLPLVWVRGPTSRTR